MVKLLRESGWAHTLPLVSQKIPCLLEVHFSILHKQSRREKRVQGPRSAQTPSWVIWGDQLEVAPHSLVSTGWVTVFLLTPHTLFCSRPFPSGLRASSPYTSPSHNFWPSTGFQTFRNLPQEVKKKALSVLQYL